MDIAKARKCPNSFSSTDCSPDVSVLKSTLIASSSSQPTGRVFPNKRDRETWEKVMAQQHYFTICLDIYWETCRLRPVASAQDPSANKIPKLRSQCCLCLTAEQHLPQHRRGGKESGLVLALTRTMLFLSEEPRRPFCAWRLKSWPTVPSTRLQGLHRACSSSLLALR